MKLLVTHKKTASSVPQSNLTKFCVRKPSNKIVPMPPALMVAAIVAIPIIEVKASRMPLKIDLVAKGNWIFRKICCGVIPMPWAASMMVGSICSMPVEKVRSKIYSLYKVKTIIAVVAPKPVSGINRAKKA